MRTGLLEHAHGDRFELCTQINVCLMAHRSMAKRRQWSDLSMAAAVDSVQKEGKGLREAARLYNLPVESLRRRVIGSVDLNCRPGLSTVLTEEEEDR